jgi:hypothetical protein
VFSCMSLSEELLVTSSSCNGPTRPFFPRSTNKCYETSLSVIPINLAASVLPLAPSNSHLTFEHPGLDRFKFAFADASAFEGRFLVNSFLGSTSQEKQIDAP